MIENTQHGGILIIEIIPARGKHMRKQGKFQQQRPAPPVTGRKGQINPVKIIRVYFQNPLQNPQPVAVVMGKQKAAGRRAGVPAYKIGNTAGLCFTAVHHQNVLIRSPQYDTFPAVYLM